MQVLTISLRQARQANDALTDDRYLFRQIEQTSSTTYDFPDDLAEEVEAQLTAFGITEYHLTGIMD